MLNFPTGNLYRGKFNTIAITIMGKLQEIIYAGDLETCKYMADKHSTRIHRILVVNDRGELQYIAN